MDIGNLRILFDTGLLILIWMVQLVIYPSFLFYKNEGLANWHKKYTISISYIVAPLMIGQLGIAIYQLIITDYSFTIIYFILVAFNWFITFRVFVPLHSKIAKGIQDKVMLKKLVFYNWLRTVVWTLIFIMSLFN